MTLSNSILALFFLFVTNATAQWSISKISSIGIFSPNSTGTISFVTQRGTVQTNCALTWTSPSIPKPWNKCDDPMLRWRISNYTDVSSLSIEIVQLALVTTPPTVNILRTNFTTDPRKDSQVCSPIANSLTNCTTWNPNVPTPTALNFTPSPLAVTWSLMRTDGASSGVIPCTAASTFYLSDPNVALLGPLTLGKGSLQPIWKTTCNTYWSCYPPSADPSINTWTGCTAPAFQIKKTLPASGGNMYSNFVLSITHTFPLMMATSVRGSNAWDRLYTDPEEAPGLDVVLTLADTPFKDGSSYFAQIIQGGIDQTGNCATGCEYGGGQVAINVASLTIV